MSVVSDPITVFLVDDQSMVRAALRSLLAESEGFEVVGDSGDARNALAEIARRQPGVVILDVSMPELSGIEAIGLIRSVHPRVRVVMLTHHEGTTFVERALTAGADGYLSKDSDPSELLVALRSVTRGDLYVSPRVSRGLTLRAEGGRRGARVASRLERMTAREREVFRLLAVGKSNEQIAAGLEISLGTVKKHRENIQRKLDCHSAADLVRLASREGLLES